MGDQYQETYHLIYEAVFANNWAFISETFQKHPELRTKPINRRLETPLMIAVGTNRSHVFVKNLLSSLSTDRDLISSALAAENKKGETAFHYAAKNGNMIDAKLLVSYSSKPVEMALHGNNGRTPLFYAASRGRKREMLDYLYSLTGVFSGPLGSGVSTPSLPVVVGPLLTNAIDAGFFDIALKLVESYSKDVLKSNMRDLQLSLSVLATKPEVFPTGSTLGPWSRCIYKLLPVYMSEVRSKKTTSQKLARDEEAIYISKEFCYNTYYKCISTRAWIIYQKAIYIPKRIFQYPVSRIKKIYDLKRTHKQTKQLVSKICKMVKEKGDQGIICAILGSTIATAVESGNYEVLKECISAYPCVIWTEFEEFKLLHEAIKQRQEQVYNLIYQMSSYKALVLSEPDDGTNDNILHIAAKLAPSHRLNAITGAALQMQRELQWFKEIEAFVDPSLKGKKNIDDKTPRMVFNDEHKELLKEGKEWMKDTASSSTVVAALIVTLAFAAVFTLPGGEQNKGKIAFTLFIVSDAIALFSSATSALLFLGILTSRYAENDFLHVLPRRLMGGLFSLFLSLASTMIAFSATLGLVLQDEGTWIAVPLVIITSIPMLMFVRIQFPLLFVLFYSTYGPGIFPKQQERMIY